MKRLAGVLCCRRTPSCWIGVAVCACFLVCTADVSSASRGSARKDSSGFAPFSGKSVVALDASTDAKKTVEPVIDMARLALTAAVRACDHEWAAAVNGDWDVAENWVGGVPVAGADVCITVEGSYSVTVPSSTEAVRSVEVDGGSGQVELTVDFGGTLSSDGPISIGVGDQLRLNGGAIAGAGSLSVAGASRCLRLRQSR